MKLLPPSFPKIGREWKRLDVNVLKGFLPLLISAILYDLWGAVTTGVIAEHKRGHSGGYSFDREPGGFLVEFTKDVLFLSLLLYALRLVFRRGRVLAEQRRASKTQPEADSESTSN
ncbi:hypothetical protein [Sphingomonas sp. RIT328]|uniref:hypothetical protein n=1 Tax=Sphingomonas sp. RIT328 TaxID=1470591 RepID=UPI001268769E|nr:hypothetical protein [Sphingomonas sp. RIT328]